MDELKKEQEKSFHILSNTYIDSIIQQVYYKFSLVYLWVDVLVAIII
jgi:hypothetical protein